MRTPLTILQGRLELIQQSGTAVEPEMLLPMQDEILRLNRLVNDLHQLSLAEAGKLALDRKKTELFVLLDKLTDLFRLEAAENGIALSLLPTAINCELDIDPNRMTQVFYNLIGNAIRHTSSGGQVHISFAKRTDFIVQIADTGTGIDAKHLPYLFDRFYRAEDDRSRVTGGMGLGLSIANQFVKAHGGSIQVDSVLGEGTTFTVYLPAG